MARRDGKKVRLISRKGKDLTYRFPLVVQAVAALPVHSCLIDGEAIISDATGLAVFSLVRSYRNGPRATLFAFDLIEIDGEDLRWRPIEDRKAALKKLLGRSPRGIAFNKHFDVEGTVSNASARHIGSADRPIGSRSRTLPRPRSSARRKRIGAASERVGNLPTSGHQRGVHA
jgi:bifunctional non-homologous end joining protein LigD